MVVLGLLAHPLYNELKDVELCEPRKAPCLRCGGTFVDLGEGVCLLGRPSVESGICTSASQCHP